MNPQTDYETALRWYGIGAGDYTDCLVLNPKGVQTNFDSQYGHMFDKNGKEISYEA